MYKIIVNPASKSGYGLKLWHILEKELRKEKIKYEIFFSSDKGDVERITRQLTEKNTDSPSKIILLGGDGTINEFLQGVVSFDNLYIGYIPTGSSNDLARDLNYPSDPIEILHNILSCEEPHPMDLGVLKWKNVADTGENPSHQRLFAVSTGIGFDAAVCEKANRSSMKILFNRLGLGKLIYLITALKEIAGLKKVSCRILVDGKPRLILNKVLFSASMIHAYEGGGFRFCPHASASDGLLDVCVVGDIPKPIIPFLLPAALKGEHLRYKYVHELRGSVIRIEAESPLWVHTDGEVEIRCRCVEVSCLPGALKLLF